MTGAARRPSPALPLPLYRQCSIDDRPCRVPSLDDCSLLGPHGKNTQSSLGFEFHCARLPPFWNVLMQMLYLY
uniref:Uncharacterized protein n=1 Tax=Arundo donax TaxID=35708 RepID=A0A0A9DA36_ARUDO